MRVFFDMNWAASADYSGIQLSGVSSTVFCPIDRFNSLQLASSVSARKGTDLEEAKGFVVKFKVLHDNCRQKTRGSRAQGTHWGTCKSFQWTRPLVVGVRSLRKSLKNLSTSTNRLKASSTWKLCAKGGAAIRERQCSGWNNSYHLTQNHLPAECPASPGDRVFS
jgi:hypothetical protein